MCDPVIRMQNMQIFILSGWRRQPYGRGCFVFENSCMQHGHYLRVRDPSHEAIEDDADQEDYAKVIVHFFAYFLISV